MKKIRSFHPMVLSLFIKIPDLLRASIAFIILCCFAVLSIIVYLANTSDLYKSVDWIMKFCPSKYRDSFEVVIHNLIQGLSPLKSISLIFKIMTLSLICWGLVYFSVFFLKIRICHSDFSYLFCVFVTKYFQSV